MNESTPFAIRINHFDVRTCARKWRHWQPLMPVCAAGTLAESVAARYGMQTLHSPGPGYVYRNERPVSNVQTVQHHAQVRLEPHLTFALVQRLLTKHERIEASWNAHHPVTSGRSPSAQALTAAKQDPPSRVVPALQPAPMIVRRAVVEPAVEAQRATSVGAAAGAQSTAGATNGHALSTPVTMDLNGLTDQVVQAIDRRIVAQRERLGRI